MNESAVSRQVSALEKELRVALFHRHARGLVLTEQGEMLFGTASEIMKSSPPQRPCSPTRPRSPRRLEGDRTDRARHHLGHAAVARSLRADPGHPGGNQSRSDEQIAIAMRAADVAIWTAEPQQSDLIRRRLFTMKHPCLRVRGAYSPQSAMQVAAVLQEHSIGVYSGTPTAHLSAIRWLETAGLDQQDAAQARVLRQQHHRHEVRDPGGDRHPDRSQTI